MESVDSMVKTMTEFHHDATSTNAASMGNLGLFDASSRKCIENPDIRCQTPADGSQPGTPLLSSVAKPAAGTTVTVAAKVPSKRPDSVLTSVKRKSTKPAAVVKNSRIVDASKTNGSTKSKHGSISGIVSSALAEVVHQTGGHPQAKQSPIEIRPIQPAINNPSSYPSASQSSLPIAFFRQCQSGLMPPVPAATISPVVFMQQENGTRFQTAAIGIAPIAPVGQTPIGGGLRFSLPQLQKQPIAPAVVKGPRTAVVKKTRTPPAKWLATIKPDLKPKSSVTDSGVPILRPQGSFDVLANGLTAHAPYQKRLLNGEESVALKKKSKKKHASEGQNATADLNSLIGMQGMPRLMDCNATSLVPLGSTVPGIAAMMPQGGHLECIETPTSVGVGNAAPSAGSLFPVSLAQNFTTASCPNVTTTTVTLASSLDNLPTLPGKGAFGTNIQTFSPNRQDPVTSGEDRGTDLSTHDSASRGLKPSPPVLSNPKPHTQGSHSNETDNGAFRKKTRLIYDIGVRKFQQINHEAVIEHPLNGTDGANSAEKPVLLTNETNRDSDSRSRPTSDSKPIKKARKPRSDKGISPRLPKSKKEKAVVTTTKTVPVKLELRRKESEEQRMARMKRLAHKWSSTSEDSIRWLVATKSVDQLKVIRWLRLVDRAFVQAESAKNFEKMERLRDSKIQAIMDLEKLQAPFEPRLMHFLHPDDQEKKKRLTTKFYANQRLTVKETRWLKEHFDRLRYAEEALPGLGATTDVVAEKPPLVPCPLSTVPCLNGVPHPGNERGNFQLVTNEIPACRPSTSNPISSVGGGDKEKSSQIEAAQPLSAVSVQTAHQFVRKFPDSTKAVIELDREGVPSAVSLLIQQPDSKAVHIKKVLKRPDNIFSTKDEAFALAMASLDHLVMKFLCIPPFPILVRYPLSAGLMNDHFSPAPAAQTRSSILSFNREIHGWETIQYVESAESGVSFLEDTVSDHDFDLANDLPVDVATRPSLLQDYLRVYPSLPEEDPDCKSLRRFGRQIASRTPLDLTAVANDPVEQRRWLCWELRHVSQQYFDLDACHQARERWHTKLADTMKSVKVPDTTLARALRFAELSRDGLRKPKSGTALVNKTIKMGEQVKDVLDSYKKERPMTRRKKVAKISHLS